SRRRYDHHEERIAHRRGPHVDGLHPSAALLFENAIILDDLVPAGHFLVGAQLEAEEFLRRSDFLCHRGPQKQDGREDQSKAAHRVPFAKTTGSETRGYSSDAAHAKRRHAIACFRPLGPSPGYTEADDG